MHSLLELSFIELKASFEVSLLRVSHVYHKKEFKNLRGVVSLTALEIIHLELAKVTSLRYENERLCHCVLRKTHGLPCAHDLEKLGPNAEIPVSLIHVHWTRLHIIEKGELKELDVRKKMEELLGEVMKLEVPYQMQAYKKMREVVYPQTSTLVSPRSKIKTRGRSQNKRETSTKRLPSAFELGEQGASQCSASHIVAKKEKLAVRRSLHVEEVDDVTKRYEMNVPEIWKPYVKKIVDVEMDGNCGFRCVAALLGIGEENWLQVRKELFQELDEHKVLYDEVFCERGRSKVLLDLLKQEGEWMTMPEVGYVIATRYNVIVFSISNVLSLTIPPLRGEIPLLLQNVEMGILHVNNCHFVQVIF